MLRGRRTGAAGCVPTSCAVALVVGVHRDRGVTEHRLDPGGGHHDVGFGVVHRAVPERHQLALDVLVLDLEVADRGLQHRRPVDQPLGLVDQPGVVEPFEDGAHGAGQALVHGEPVAAPVHAVAEAAHLRADGAAGLVLPVPHLVDEQFAAEVLLGLAVDGELLLHHASGWRCRRGPCRAATAPRSPASACGGSARPSGCGPAHGPCAGCR